MSGSTARPGHGRTAALPDGFYEPPPTVEVPKVGGGGFTGEDGGECLFRFEELPLGLGLIGSVS
ncbi:hypothetical protein ACFW7J_05735 [Streptomyces sp. NPDC059525]|uniref:hypothetical protein n=1 Tax=Streptomyces sp. NPDC059525 TaxID=3346857 RepID=UPI0036A2CBA3